MRYFLPPAEPPRARRQIPRISALAAVESSTDLLVPTDDGGIDRGRLVRVVTLDEGGSSDYLDRWSGDRPQAVAIPSRPGVRAVERHRPEIGVGALGGPTVRRQRLAVAERDGTALAAHWSVPEPATKADLRAWDRLLDRLEREIAGKRSWTA